MSLITPKLKHDFINNTLRLEVLNNLIAEALDAKSEIPQIELLDLIKFTQLHLELVNQINSES